MFCSFIIYWTGSLAITGRISTTDCWELCTDLFILARKCIQSFFFFLLFCVCVLGGGAGGLPPLCQGIPRAARSPPLAYWVFKLQSDAHTSTSLYDWRIWEAFVFVQTNKHGLARKVQMSASNTADSRQTSERNWAGYMALCPFKTEQYYRWWGVQIHRKVERSAIRSLRPPDVCTDDWWERKRVPRKTLHICADIMKSWRFVIKILIRCLNIFRKAKEEAVHSYSIDWLQGRLLNFHTLGFSTLPSRWYLSGYVN